MAITAKIARDPSSGMSKGYGFVSYTGFESFDATVESMNGQFPMNKAIMVQYAFKKDADGTVHLRNVSSLPKPGKTTRCLSVPGHPPHRWRLVRDLSCRASKDRTRVSLQPPPPPGFTPQQTVVPQAMPVMGAPVGMPIGMPPQAGIANMPMFPPGIFSPPPPPRFTPEMMPPPGGMVPPPPPVPQY